MTTGLTAELLTEVLRDTHRYRPGIEPDRPSLDSRPATLRTRLRHAGHRGRDLVERGLDRAGFTRRHHDARAAGAALARILSLEPGLEATADRLGDDASRRALLDVLKLRVLGPYHAPLAISPDRFRALQSYADRTLRRQAATFEIADPFFSPLSRYDVPAPGGATIDLHVHSVDVVSVFLLNQYSYSGPVVAEPGDVVLDIGGCWGDTALYFASLVGPEGRVYTFEFDPENLVVMRANLALNPALAARIEIVDRALWSRSGEQLEFSSGGRMTSVLTRADATTRSVETLTVDDFAQSLERVDLIKMDVEGAELDVLAGARSTLAAHAPKLALAAYHRDDDLVRIPEAIAAAGEGYELFLKTSSPLEDETVLFARVPGRRSGTPAASRRNST